MQQGPLSKKFHILSLDGGGIKGLFSAAILAAIEEDTGVNIIEHFDLITGTSTGGIIALGLGLGMRPREIVNFYLDYGQQIFPPIPFYKGLIQWFRYKYSNQPLKEALQKCFGDKTLGDSKVRLVIPSYNIGDDDVYLFKTPHHEKLRRDYKVPAWKVALATTAAPTFFPCTREVDNIRLIDGGVWANNPTMVGIIEAYKLLGVHLDALSVLSIGTSDEVIARHERLNKGGKFAWVRGNDVIDVIMRGQSIAANNQAGLLLGKEKVHRINPKVAAGEFTLDGANKADDLIGKASHASRQFIPIFEKIFKEHKAIQYTPLYSVGKEESVC
ncbi:MAG: CBASS cGAMP-activated phospholipase [Peptococcaceae bacterium]|nr:patatin-like phospholipase family protein [Peptococcaceae bacterium]MDH7524428.1 CBASS cGAMP-activated phospholipase [Peptococcaceae bacterium]